MYLVSMYNNLIVCIRVSGQRKDRNRDRLIKTKQDAVKLLLPLADIIPLILYR